MRRKIEKFGPVLSLRLWLLLIALAVETAAYRIVQEALTNVARHAKGNEAIVRLWARAHILGVQVEDRGNGFNPEEAFAAARQRPYRNA